MRQAIAIIRRDLAEKRFVFAAALAFSIIPFVVLLIPSARGDSVAILANMIAVNFAIALAIGLGATMIGSDLSAGRLSFYFSRPISASAIWYGKLVAAILMVDASLAIVATPGALYSASYPGGEWIERPTILAIAAVAAPVVILIAHVISTFVRGRSAILLADALALAATISAGWLVARPLVDAGALTLLSVVFGVVAAAGFAALILAGAWQLSRGRTDRRANHLELAKFLWPAVLLILIIAGAYVAWVVRVKPADLTNASIYRAPDGPWMLVDGEARYRMDYHAGLLVNSSDGRYARVPAVNAMFGAFTFSRDGRVAAWLEPTDVRRRRGEIWTRRLEPLGPPLRTNIAASTGLQLVLSDDGSRLAYTDNGLLSVADAATGKSLGVVRLPRTYDLSMFFVTNDVVRLYFNEASDKVTSIAEFDVRNRTLRRTGEVRIDGRLRISLAVSPDGSRAMFRSVGEGAGKGNMLVVDARSGAPMATLSIEARAWDTTVLSDGTIAVLTRNGSRGVLHLFSSNGTPVGDIDLGPAQWATLGGNHGSLAVASVNPNQDLPSAWRTLIVDAAAKRVHHVVEHVRAARELVFYEDDPRYRAPSSAIFPGLDARGKIVRIDAITGAVTPLPD